MGAVSLETAVVIAVSLIVVESQSAVGELLAVGLVQPIQARKTVQKRNIRVIIKW